MAKLTKLQSRRMVRDIQAKVKKLFLNGYNPANTPGMKGIVVSVKDVEAIDRMCHRWLTKIG